MGFVVSALKIIQAGTLVILPVYIGWYLYTKAPEPPDRRPANLPSPSNLIQKPVLTIFDKNLPTIRMAADSVYLTASRFFVFRINAVKKPVIVNAVLEFHYYSGTRTKNNISFFNALKLPEKNHKITIRSITWNFYKDRKLRLSIRSKMAHVHLKQKQIRLRDATLKFGHAPGEYQASEVTWKDASHRLSVRYHKQTFLINPNTFQAEKGWAISPMDQRRGTKSGKKPLTR